MQISSGSTSHNNLFAIFGGIPLKLAKVSLTLPCPSLPCLATDGMKQFQCLIVVLFLEFNIDAKTSFFMKTANSKT